MNWTHYCAAAQLKRIKNSRVLVVGANTGDDCRPFIQMGAAEVHGIDPIDNVGTDFQHRAVTYHRSTIEAAKLPSNYFDLVFSVATLEHVHDLHSAYAAVVDLCSPGGAIYVCAAPLWNSPYGHHLGCFEGHPWVHLIYSKQELIDFAKTNCINGERGLPIESLISYILDGDAFNRKSAADYVSATSAIKGLSAQDTYLDTCQTDILHNGNGNIARSKGFPDHELISVTHYFKAIKRGGKPTVKMLNLGAKGYIRRLKTTF